MRHYGRMVVGLVLVFLGLVALHVCTASPPAKCTSPRAFDCVEDL